MSAGYPSLLESLYAPTRPPSKPRVFVSYQHGNDQFWYDAFSRTFSSSYDVFTDKSLERKIDSDDADYTRRSIREQNITGSSLTIVLCGAETWKRRWVDWEIQMTLNKQHALLGIALPTCAKDLQERCIVSDRLFDNTQSGYAAWLVWPQNIQALQVGIADARKRAMKPSNRVNNRPAMQRSHS